MHRFVLFRVAQAVATLFVLSAAIFTMVNLSGDPVLLMLPPFATVEDREQLRKNLGLDKPLLVQYGLFLRNLSRGELGNSITTRRPARDVLFERLPATLQLAAGGMILAILVGVPLGILTAVTRDSIFDRAGRMLAVLCMAAPAFWIAIMLILLFGVTLKWLPTFGRGGPDHFILPCTVVALPIIASMVRLGRSSMLEILDSEFIKFARMKGVGERLIIWKHALRNALIPLVTFGGISLAGLLNGAIVVEVVFAWPGVGRLMLEGVRNKDFPIVEATVLTSGFFFILTATLVDILYAYIDPRIRYD